MNHFRAHRRTPDSVNVNPSRCLTQCPDQNGPSASSMPNTEQTKMGFPWTREALHTPGPTSGSGRGSALRRVKLPIFEGRYTVSGPN